MAVQFEWLSVAAVAVALFLAGCDSSSTPPSPTVTKIGPAAGNPTEVAKPKSQAPTPANASQATTGPVESVRALLDGLGRQNLRVVWDFLPASYQSDINSVVHNFAESGDPETWKRTFRLVADSSELLKSKRQFFLSYPRLNESNQLHAAELEKSWEPTVGLLDTLIESDLADPEKLRTIDVGQFLDRTGGRLMQQLAEISKSTPENPAAAHFGSQFSDMKVELVRQEGDGAVLKLTPADTKVPPTDTNFVLVEGKWIPQSLADGWKPAIAQVRERIAAMKAEGNKSSQSTAVVLGQLEGTIAELQRIDEPAEFHKRLDEALVMLAGLVQNVQGPIASNAQANAAPNSENTPTGDAVSIVIDGRLDGTTEGTLCNQLIAIIDDDKLALAEAPVFSGGRTTIRVWPIKDVTAFAKRIDFARVVNVDAGSHQVTLELDEAKTTAP